MKTRIFASLLALCLLIGTLAGCGSKESIIATQGGVEIPIGYYTTQQMLMRVQLENYYGDGYEDYMASPSQSDPSKTNAQALNETYQRAFEMLWLFKLKVEEFGLEMDEIRLAYFDKEYEYFKYLFNSTADYRMFLKQANMTEEEHRQIYMESTYYSDLIYAYYYDPDIGVERLGDEEVKAYFDSLVDYSIKHILFSYEDDKAAAKQEAEDVLAKITSGELKFDDAMNEYSDDSDLARYPDGYGFLEYEESFPAVFTDAAKELREGEYGIYESEHGYHIILRINNEEYYQDVQSVYGQAYCTEQLQAKYDAWLAELDFQYNEKALEAFDFSAKGRTNVNLRQKTS